MLPSCRPPARALLDQPAISPEQAARADAVLLGASHGTPYRPDPTIGYAQGIGSAAMPDAVRVAANASSSNIDHYDFDLGGPPAGERHETAEGCGRLGARSCGRSLQSASDRGRDPGDPASRRAAAAAGG